MSPVRKGIDLSMQNIHVRLNSWNRLALACLQDGRSRCICITQLVTTKLSKLTPRIPNKEFQGQRMLTFFHQH